MEKFKDFPSVNINFSQLIRDNVEEALSGVKGANSIKLFGNDLDVLERAGQRVINILNQVRGISNPGLFHIVGQPNLEIQIDRHECCALRDQRVGRRGRRAGRRRRPGIYPDGRRAKSFSTSSCACPKASATIPRSSAGSPSTRPVRTASREPGYPFSNWCTSRRINRGSLHLSREQSPLHPHQVQRQGSRPGFDHRRSPGAGQRSQVRRTASTAATTSIGRANFSRWKRPTAA